MTPYEQGFDDAANGNPLNVTMLRGHGRQSYLNGYYHAKLERRQTARQNPEQNAETPVNQGFKHKCG